MDKISKIAHEKLDLKANNSNLRAKLFQSNQGMKKADIINLIKNMQELNKSKMKTHEIAINLHFNEAGWRPGTFQDFSLKPEEFDLFSIHDYYDASDEEALFLHKIGVDNMDDYKFNYFRIIFKKKALNAGGNDDHKNDCLYRALTLGCFKIRFQIKTPHGFKKRLGLKRTARVSIDLIPEIEKILDISINVEGDYNYTPEIVKKFHVNLILCNGHYELKKSTSLNAKTIICKPKNPRQLMIKNDNLKMAYSEDGLIDYKKEANRKYMIITTDDKDLEKVYNENLENLRQFEMKTGYNLLEFKSNSKLALYHFFNYIRKQGIHEPDGLSEIEKEWFLKCNHGGIRYTQKNCKFDNAYEYDKISAYPSLMKSMLMPYKQGTKLKYDELPKKLSYGLYKCIIESGHKYYRYNKDNIYTHLDIKKARSLKLNVTLIDTKFNAIVYYEDDLVNTLYLFKEFYNFWYPLKSQKVPFVKNIFNSLWGRLCSYDYKFKPHNNKDPEHYNLQTIKLNDDCQAEETVYINRINPFTYDGWVRLKPFLLSKMRDEILEYIYIPAQEGNLIYVHTDGFITHKPVTYKRFLDKVGKSWTVKEISGNINKSGIKKLK